VDLGKSGPNLAYKILQSSYPINMLARRGGAILRRTFTTMAEEYKVIHEADKNAFTINFNNGDKALLEYSKISDNALDYNHTYVPTSQRGKGIAGIITSHAFEWAKANNKKVYPSCTYIKNTYLPNAPDDQKAIVIDKPNL